MIKGSLKVWHHNHVQNLDSMVKEVKDHISSLDSKQDDGELAEDLVEELHALSANLFSLSEINFVWNGKNLD